MVAARAADIAEPAMAQRQQMRGHGGRTLALLHQHRRHVPLGGRHAHGHDRHVGIGQRMGGPLQDPAVEQQHAVGLAGQHEVDQPLLLLRIVVQVADQQPIAPRGQGLIDAEQELAEERRDEGRHHHQHHHRPRRPQAAPGDVRRVAGAAHDLEHVLARLGVDPARIGQRPAHRGDRDAGQGGYLRDVHRTAPAAGRRRSTQRLVIARHR